MSLLNALYRTYEYAKENDLVGKFDENKSIILPLFHTSQKSNGSNIVEVLIDKESNIISAKFLIKDELIIFPVTEDSVSRSSNSAPHMLTDSFKYLINGDNKKHSLYMQQLCSWIEYSDDEFLKIIYKFLDRESVFYEILSKLYKNYKVLPDLKVEVAKQRDSKEEKNTVDFSKINLFFRIEDYFNKRDISYNENQKLQKDYISYINHINELDNSKEKIVCNISGENDYLCKKHRPLIDSARIISQITANEENYFGRFQLPEQTIKIGLESSQEIILMAKYLLDNKNSCRWLGDRAYVISWFSHDISNETNMDLCESNRFFEGNEDSEKRDYQIVDETSESISSSFVSLSKKIPDESKYYLAILDKVSNGRVAAKYFKEIDTSILKKNLSRWQERYHWYIKKKTETNFRCITPSINWILTAAYGTERNGKLEISSGKSSFAKFKSMQLQNMIAAMLEARTIPENIRKKLDENIKDRHRYKETWNYVKFAALAVLRDKEGIKDNMLDRNNNDRSYLYGRLLALHEMMEASCYDKDSVRETNAQKMRNSYINSPLVVDFRLRNLIKPYENKLKLSEKKGYYIKIRKEMSEVYDKISSNYDINNPSTNKALGPSFIYGYEGELHALFNENKKGDKND